MREANDVLLDPVTRIVLDQIDVPVFVVADIPERGFVLAHLNPCYERATGFEIDALRGLRMFDMLPPRVAETILGNYRRCRNGANGLSYEEILALNGRERWWRTTLSSVPRRGGYPDAIIGVALDITDAKTAEFRAADEIARKARRYEDLRAFAGLTAHDMRGPLGNVISLTELILDGFVDMGDRKRDLVQMCADIATRSLASIDEIMAQVSDDEERIIVDTPVELDRMCADIGALIDPEGRLDLRFPHAAVQTDRAILQLALRNLMDNANRFCRSRIIVRLDDAPRDDLIALTVHDDGPGFPPGFDLEEHLARPMPLQKGSRGFGLRTVAELLRSRGGALELAPPRDGEGAVLTITVAGQVLSAERASAAA